MRDYCELIEGIKFLKGIAGNLIKLLQEFSESFFNYVLPKTLFYID